MKQYIKLLLTLCVAAIPAKADIPLWEEYEDNTTNMMKQVMKEYRLPSLSLAISIGEKVVFAKAMGYANIEENQAANIETQYSVGSLAKPMTGLALAKLVDKGKLSLDDKVSKYVGAPAYTELFSVKELASHTSGVPHNTKERDIAEFDTPRDHKSPFDAFYVFESHPLLFAPGTDYKYSSNGYILLSAAIEQAANESFPKHLEQSLWSSFGMKHTELDTSFAGKDHEAIYYAERTDDGSYIRSTTKRDRSFLFGAGGFISTPSDLVKMAQASYHKSYLSSAAQKALFEPVKLRNGEVNAEKYSLGWRVGNIKLSKTSEDTWIALHHGGVTDKASTAYLFVIPECKASIAFATNYVPEKFWKIRGTVARTLLKYVQADSCSKFNKSSGDLPSSG